ncbi:DUF1330 domain-containing protein [Mesorhizobium sp. B4-1-3]|uniref:DUF1330 domain-containing protein n=1 Tax=Mesorhizobium sp. B4-1-3 TaxID=2589889 RepID=UPI001129C082|nr:DUF1330 domain-containing protein [Mesorhizobium sp. B4-1-3]TPI16946.1 DUF1330 domain-containing protein [Mesorhizobium sp. B4-1-3]
MNGYWLIVGTEISNEEAQAEYARLWKPIGEKYQARTNTTKQPPLLVEARDAKRMVLVEFPSLELAKACWRTMMAQRAACGFAHVKTSPAYAAACVRQWRKPLSWKDGGRDKD